VFSEVEWRNIINTRNEIKGEKSKKWGDKKNEESNNEKRGFVMQNEK
jgi:hypothetical protein